MAQGIDSTKSAARPSHEAIEQEADATEAGNSAHTRLDHIAMEAAKRSGNRIVADEETFLEVQSFRNKKSNMSECIKGPA